MKMHVSGKASGWSSAIQTSVPRMATEQEDAVRARAYVSPTSMLLDSSTLSLPEHTEVIATPILGGLHHEYPWRATQRDPTEMYSRREVPFEVAPPET